MPTYEFLCRKCNKVFDVSFSIREYERRKKTGIKCVKCGSSRIAQQISLFQVNAAKKS